MFPACRFQNFASVHFCFIFVTLSHQHQIRWSRRRDAPRADPRDTTTTTETAGAGAPVAAAMKGTDLVALLMSAIAGDRGVPESECSSFQDVFTNIQMWWLKKKQIPRANVHKKKQEPRGHQVLCGHFFSINFWFDVQKRWACFTAFSASVQIQAEVSQRVQRTISIALQVPHACRKPCPIFPLPRGRSATDAFPLAVQVQVCVEIPVPFTLSLPILGRTQVRGPLDHLLYLIFLLHLSKKSVCFDTNVMSLNYL